jgi:hypothetical protein
MPICDAGNGYRGSWHGCGNACGTPRVDDGRMTCPPAFSCWACREVCEPCRRADALVAGRSADRRSDVRNNGDVHQAGASRIPIRCPPAWLDCYKSAVGAVRVSVRELAGHGAAFGRPGCRSSLSTRSAASIHRDGTRSRWTAVDTGRTSARRSARPASVKTPCDWRLTRGSPVRHGHVLADARITTAHDPNRLLGGVGPHVHSGYPCAGRAAG